MNLTQLNSAALTTQERMQLAPFQMAYTMPYPEALTWRQLRAEGLEPREWAGCGLQEIQEGMDEIDLMSSFHLDEDGMVVPGEGERASWQDRLINKWSRR